MQIINSIITQTVYPAVAISIILIALAYILRHPFIKEGSSQTKNIVAVAIGVMLTILITHLLPEIYNTEHAAEGAGVFFGISVNSFVFLFSLIAFYILGWTTHDHEHDDEHEHHSHTHGHRLETSNADSVVEEKSVPVMFIGQGVHSIADGVVIASSFAVNVFLGIVTTVAISIHHIPMMSGVVLRHNNKNNFRKLFWATIVSSAFMFVGLGLFSYIQLSDISSMLIAVAAASFLYVGAYDLTSYLREYDDKKIIKRIAFIFLGVAIGIASQYLGGESAVENAIQNKTNSDSVVATSTKSFEDGTIAEDDRDILLASTAYLNTSVEYPKNNTAVKSWILEKYNNFASDSNRVMDEYDHNPYEYQAGYTAATSSDYISYVYSIYNFTGGAHGGSDIISYTTNIKTGVKINSLTDIYKPEIYKYLEKYSRTDLTKQFGLNGADQMSDAKWLAEGTLANATNYNSFWFEGDYLVVHFGQYQVAAYAAGMYEVRVPLSELAKFKK